MNPNAHHADLPYEIIIGLEVHVQLATRTKLFCRCDTRFGMPPNTQTCAWCLGLPGTLPVMNRRAFQLAMRAAVALDCEISPITQWDRKNYYYPDLPKGFQITQYDLPLATNGYLDIPGGYAGRHDSSEDEQHQPRRIGIVRAHLEEDAGKSLHDDTGSGADSRIDMNRAGVPLLEIVSQPDLRSPAEAKAYLVELKLLLNYLGISDCNMEEGSLRVDANINLHITTPQGIIATPIAELKNINSFRGVERALAFEAARQWEAWQASDSQSPILGSTDSTPEKTTRRWDSVGQVTQAQRGKEEVSDYRYFPEPDLVPVVTTVEEVEIIRANLGERPAALRMRLAETCGITSHDAAILVQQGRALVDYYIAVTEACEDGKLAANWIQQDVLRILNERSWELAEYSHHVPPASLGALLTAVKKGELSTSRARVVLDEMLATDCTATAAMKSLGVEPPDEAVTYALCQELLASNPQIVTAIQSGTDQAVGPLIHQAKQHDPNIDPARVREICLKLALETTEHIGLKPRMDTDKHG